MYLSALSWSKHYKLKILFQTSSLSGHGDAVQCVLFEQNGDFLVSGGTDKTVRIWC